MENGTKTRERQEEKRRIRTTNQKVNEARRAARTTLNSQTPTETQKEFQVQAEDQAFRTTTDTSNHRKRPRPRTVAKPSANPTLSAGTGTVTANFALEFGNSGSNAMQRLPRTDQGTVFSQGSQDSNRSTDLLNPSQPTPPRSPLRHGSPSPAKQGRPSWRSPSRSPSPE